MSIRSMVCAAVTTTLVTSGAAYAQIKIGVVSSTSGPVALVGIPQKNTVALLPKEVAGQKIEYFALDDASDPTSSVAAFKKLINEEKVDALIGPSGSPSAMGVIQFAAEAGVPMLAPVGTAAVVLPMNDQKKWVFKTTQNDDLIATALVDHMKATGIKSVGLIGSADAYGENWAKVMVGLLQTANIKLVSSESFQRRDTSVTAQSLKTLAARPDAVLIAAPGSAAVLPQATLFDQGVTRHDK